MADSRGFIKLNRKILKNNIWFWDVFTRGQAWIDLLLVAEFTDGEFYSRRGIIKYKRGDCLYSLTDLAERWKWSRGKVRNFLTYLEENKMIKRKLEKNTYSVITILNYSQYQDKNIVSGSNDNSKKDEREQERERNLRFLLGDEYDEYMAEQRGIKQSEK